MEEELQRHEVTAARCLGRLLAHRLEGVLPGDPAAARVAAAAPELAADLRCALASITRVALLLEDAHCGGGGTAAGDGGLDDEGAALHALQLERLRAQYARVALEFEAFQRRMAAEAHADPPARRRAPREEPGEETSASGAKGGAASPPTGDLSDTAAAGGGAGPGRRSWAAAAAPGGGGSGAAAATGRRPQLARTSAAATAAALRRTRAAMQAELERIGAVSGVLDQDAASLERTGQEHEGYAGDVAEGKARARAYAQQAAADRRAVLAAFALLALSAGYIVARRVLWTFLGVRLP